MGRGGPRPGGFHKGHKFNQGKTRTTTASVADEPVADKKPKPGQDVVEMLMSAIRKRGAKKFFAELPAKDLAMLAGRLLPKDFNVNSNSSISISINLSTSPSPIEGQTLPGETERDLLTRAVKEHSTAMAIPLLDEDE
jgi:hypothetical protein